MAVINQRTMRQAIATKYLGPTDTRGARIKASCEAGSVTVAWDHGLNVDQNHAAAATSLASKLGWDDSPMAGGALPGMGYAFVCID
jgi:hypothetical protein